MGDTIHTLNKKMEEFIHNAYESLKNGDEVSALGFLKTALEADFEQKEVMHALKCLNWWLEKIKRLEDFHSPYERGGYILSQWKSYNDFLDRIGESYDSCQYAMKRFVFSRALYYFLILLQDRVNQQDPTLLYQTGRCCKGVGDWEDAQNYLQQASRFRREDSAILSELADVYALLEDERKAKVLFREAFYFDPQAIDLPGLESEMILQLRNKVREAGYAGEELAEWIPIWGSIWGIFSKKRELKPVELGRLKQSILSLESEYRSKGQKSGANTFLKPRLLNRYFWLIDHCESNRDTSGLIDETMLKIKFIDPVVYEHYRT